MATDGRGDSGPAGACSGWDNRTCAGTEHCPPRCPRFFDGDDRPLLVRPYRATDRDALIEMYVGIETTTLGLPPVTRTGVERWLADLAETGWNLLAWDDDTPLGHIAVVPADAAVPEFVVFVADDAHGRGIGTELVKQAVAHAAADGIDRLALIVEPANEPAIAVYSNVGFEVVHRGITLEMSLPLDDPIAETVRLAPAERPVDE